MSSYKTTYSQDNRDRRYTLTFKVNWSLHTQVLELASKRGVAVSEMGHILLDAGIEFFMQREKDPNVDPKAKIFQRLSQVHNRSNLLDSLAQIRASTPEIEFNKLCRENEIDPDEVDDSSANSSTTKDDRCYAFLRVLFTDRPEGLPANRVLEIAEEEGFGRRMTRINAQKLGIRIQRQCSPTGQLSMWIPRR